MKHLRSSRGAVDMIVIAVVLIGALLVGGYFIYQQQQAGSGGTSYQPATTQDNQASDVQDPAAAVTNDSEASNEDAN
ncbi:MAG TPA: hypothetical protein VLF21_00970 [Candidatus Saccharimonadales bacterium]|nr:hypothetical protein [Candidatus Saccharimonadales bacterium]